MTVHEQVMQSVLQTIQHAANRNGLGGEVQKRHNGYWLVQEGQEAIWLGGNKEHALSRLEWLAEDAVNDYYQRIGEERYGQTSDYDPDRREWDERCEWLAWWEKVEQSMNQAG